MSASRHDYLTWAGAQRVRVEGAISQHLPHADARKGQLTEAMRYAVLGGGKRVRALLVYACAEFSFAKLDDADFGAIAVELIHAYSLVHDDLPCMDNDVLRRGQPTCHVKFGEATAMLAGDALQPLAFEVLLRSSLAASAQLEQTRLLATASGADGMAGGQAIDLTAVGRTLDDSELQTMHELKTGALIRASALMGLHCGRTTPEQVLAVDTYARWLGLAFQVRDDVLDVEGDSAAIGKTVGKDADNNKPTYVSALGLAGAKALARALTERAHEALSDSGDRATRLHALADDLLERTA